MAKKRKKRVIAARLEGKVNDGLYLIRVAKTTRFRKKLLKITEV